ncbi:MAG TPA: NAD(P)H-hydrate dehydratase [Usitatibacter sp.]|nr:NAD(P)H-hydrate dehydratase [Usitatibacter sp.]
MRAPVLTLESLREVEARFARADPPLMERAGRAVAEAARAMAADTGARILVVAGPGNNGGDAWVAARHLQQSFHKVVVLNASAAEPRAAQAQAAKAAFVAGGGEVTSEWPGVAPALVVDGLLGIGLARDVDARMAAIIAHMNAAGAPVLAIDVPSGLDAATGRVLGTAVKASRTLTFIAHKAGLHTLGGPDLCGEVVLDELGTGEAVREVARGELLAPRDVAAWLAPRRRNVHKGDFGTLGIVGGNRGMVGAALLAGRAALLAGAGRVRVGLLAADAPTVDLQQPELMLQTVDDTLASDVLVMGPGAGRSVSATSVSMFERTLLPAAVASAKPLVLDADAINTVAFNDTLRAEVARRKAPTIATPHPAEAARLLQVKTAEVQADRVAAALTLARDLRVHVVLKGAGSICASPDGAFAINTTGNAGLASGGTGDVLAGLLGALLCQGLEPARALRYAVCLHGAAADSLVARGRGPAGLTASEVAFECRRLLNLWTATA